MPTRTPYSRPDPDVTVYCPDEPWHRQRTVQNLDHLLEVGCGLAEEADAIRAALAAGKPFCGGGGAAPYFEIHAHTDLSSLVPAGRLMGLGRDALEAAYSGFLGLTKARALSADELLFEIAPLLNTWAECRWLEAFIAAWQAMEEREAEEDDASLPLGVGAVTIPDLRLLGLLVAGVAF